MTNKVTLLTEWKYNSTDWTSADPDGSSAVSIVPDVYGDFDAAVRRAKLICESFASYYSGSVKFPDERNFESGDAWEFVAFNNAGVRVRAVTLRMAEVR